MRTFWHDVWGCGRGPATRLAPPTRLAVGGIAMATCIIVPVLHPPGVLVLLGTALSWLAACRPPRRIVGLLVLVGLALFLPYFLLAPLLRSADSGGTAAWLHALEVPWGIFVRGLSGMLVSVATVTTLRLADLREALDRLRMPRLVSAILQQIIHQTAALAGETRRIAAAMTVRGASGGGRTAWRVLASLPRVWLPRVVLRAERVGAAMELRGYGEGTVPLGRRSPIGRGDVLAVFTAFMVLALAIVLRAWGAA